MILRQKYLDKIIPLIDKPFVKVITGIRRCGKSVILKQIMDFIVQNGASAEQIIYYNFENLSLIELNNHLQLYTDVKNRLKKHLPDGKRYYIFFDEIQEVKGWEKVVNSLLSEYNVDLYITGSNSKLLSSELSTYIAGRYVEFPVYTLSFQEFLLFKEHRTGTPTKNIHADFDDYLKLGGFPAIHLAEYEIDTVYKIVTDIYSSVILRDTIQRHGIRNIDVLDRLIKFIFESIGHIFSAKNIANYFKNQQIKIDISTVYNYLNALESAFIIQKAPRYDIRGKEALQTNEKYFVSDISLVHAVLGYKSRLIAGFLENIVFLELKRRDYNVCVGKDNEREVDFIAEKNGQKIYVQVAYKITELQTYEREFGVFRRIDDNYPKYVVSTDQTGEENIEGIKHWHITDFLLSTEY